MNDQPLAAILPPIATWPPRVQALPRDKRGFPVPWFVTWFRDGKRVRSHSRDAEPDFRVADLPKVASAIKGGLCWVCGQTLGRHVAFLIGPMCAINRVSSEPPSHRGCAEFAVRACPFLISPRMRRNAKDLPEERVPPAGHGFLRNPGVALVWVTESFRTAQAQTGNPGILFEIGEPEHLGFYAQGRPATRAEVVGSIESGLPLLRDVARREGSESERDLEQTIARAWPLLWPFLPAEERP